MQSFRFKSRHSPELKFLSKPTMLVPHIQHKNMFLNPKPPKQAFHNITMYSIVGDTQFKQKFLQQNTISNSPATLRQQKSLLQQGTQISQNNPNFILTLRQSKQGSQLNQFFHSTIYLDEKQQKKVMSKFNRIKKNTFSRQNRILKSFIQKQKSWSEIQKNLKWKTKKNQTITFDSVKKIYHHENPQKIQIINDMIPQYWQKSLRDNDKKLKSHIKGNPFKREHVEEMLQTLKGSKKLQESIPKIGLSKTIDVLNKGLSLKGKRQQKEGRQTMRSFHKTFFQQISKKQNVMKSQRFPKKLKQLQDQSILKKYNFCKDLQTLEGIDNELYKRQFQRNKRWLNQGYDF